MRSRLMAVFVAVALLAASCASGSDAEVAEAAASPPADDPATVDEVTTPAPTAAPAVTDDSAAPSATACLNDESFTGGRTDVQPSGNRHAPGAIELLTAAVSAVELPATPTWVVPFAGPERPCEPRWYVTLDDGAAVTVDATGTVADAGPAVSPPEAGAAGVASANAGLADFENPLPDGRIVSFGRWRAALVDPTDRYGHGVLGDRIEAGSVEILDTTTGVRTRITIDPPTVIEGISPMLIDVDEATDAVPEVLVTLSNETDGAWLALYDLDGTLRARSEAIDQGNRWRNQLGASRTGANAFEIVDVRTPHLTGVVEFFQLNDDRLERKASIDGYTSHVIGSRNLDMGILIDADRDGVAEVVLPTRDLGSLAVIDRTDEDAVELGRVDLGGTLTTNLGTQSLAGQTWLAVGTRQGTLLVFG